MKLLLQYSLYSLIVVMFFFGASLFVERQMERQQLSIQEDRDNRASQIEKTLQHIEMIMSANKERMAVIEKVSTIIASYNSSLDERTRQKFANEIYTMTIKWDNLDVDLICATITHESARTWDSTIVSHAGAMGLMQIMPATGKHVSQQEGIEWTNSKDILFNPIYNIRLGSRYLSTLLGKYTQLGMKKEYAVQAALAAYNGGERRVALWIKKKRNNKYLYSETQKYLPRVLGLYEQFAAISM